MNNSIGIRKGETVTVTRNEDGTFTIVTDIAEVTITNDELRVHEVTPQPVLTCSRCYGLKSNCKCEREMPVSVYYNGQTDDAGRAIAMMDGYTEGDPFGYVTSFTVRAGSVLTACEKVYREMNCVDGDERVTTIPQTRSMSVGDLVCVDGSWFAVADFGFDPVAEPSGKYFGDWQELRALNADVRDRHRATR